MIYEGSLDKALMVWYNRMDVWVFEIKIGALEPDNPG